MLIARELPKTNVKLVTLVVNVSQYIQYSKLKRIINRRKFIADRDEADAEIESRTHSRMASPAPMNVVPALPVNSSNEYTQLNAAFNVKSSSTFDDDCNGTGVQMNDMGQGDDESDFFKVILSEIEKVNKFFVG